ncbi:hypothetical protein LCGC14_3064280, partial [marine sediment metagenome]
QHCRAALATSGTVTLELGLHKVPTIVVYRISLLNAFLAKCIFRIHLPYYGLVNIIANDNLFQERIHTRLSAKKTAEYAGELLNDTPKRKEVIAGCETLESFQPLREDLDRLSRALYAAELADRFLAERVESAATYRLLLDTLRRLQSDADTDLTLRHYEMKLLDQSGFRPELDRCLGCEQPLQPQQNFFSPLAGGTCCPSCGAGAAGSRSLSADGLKVLRLLQRMSYNQVRELNMPPALAQEVERHQHSYIVCVLERDVNAAAFVERLRREKLPLEI